MKRRFGIAATVLLALLLLAFLIPEQQCSVDWLDHNFEPLEPHPAECPSSPRVQKLGTVELMAIHGVAYVARHEIKREGPGFPCMTGVTCLPIPQRGTVYHKFTLREVEGRPPLSELRSIGGKGYLTDGHFLYYEAHRLDPGVRFDLPGFTQLARAAYASDGKVVLYQATAVPQADPASMRDAPVVAIDGTETGYDAVALDRNAAYYQQQRIDGADPASFGVIFYTNHALPPPLDESGGWVAIDAYHAWHLGGDSPKMLALPPSILAQLRRYFQGQGHAPSASPAMPEQ